MRSRFLAITAASSLVASTLVAPAAFADVDATNDYIAANFKNPFTLPTNAPQDVVLQAGATESSVLLNWITAAGVDGQAVRIKENGGETKTIDAKSTDSKVTVTEGKIKDPEVEPVWATVANHKAGIDGLKENTEYTYSVGSDKDGWSKEYTFNTGTFGDKWNFLVFGDPQLYSTKDLAKQTAGWNNTVTQATKRFPESSFLLSVGDQANHSALQEHGGFISPDPMRAHRTVVTMGNHDYYHAPSYEAVYNRPNVEDENYWFTYNNALVINMDTNDWEDFDDDAAFLRKVVKEQGTDKDWVILTYHHSTFSQAYHQEDRGIQYWRERMTPVISELDVDLVLGGHDHIYTRSHLMNGYTPVDSGRVAQKGETLEKKKGETQYVTANSASGSKYYQFFDFKTGVRDEDVKETFDQTVKEKTIRDYTAVWNQNEVPDYTNVEVTPEGLTVTTYDTGNGDVVDAFTLKHAKEEAPAEQPSQESSDSAEDGSSKGAVIGIVIAIIAALAAAGGAAYMGLIPGVQLPQF